MLGLVPVMLTHSCHVLIGGMLQVVGRVHQGEELLQQLNSCPVDLDDKPSPALVISACGITNARVSVSCFRCCDLAGCPHAQSCMHLYAGTSTALACACS